MHLESGTPNLMGYYGLAAALRWLERTGPQRIHDREMQLYDHLLAGLQQLGGLRIHGTQDRQSSLCVLAVTAPGLDIGRIARRLDAKHKIITRCGLHCAPHANRALGTWPTGTLRLSPGYFSKPRELDYVLESLAESLWYVRKHRP